MNYLGISQRSNAGSFLSLLEATGLVKDGGLTERGTLLLGPSDSDDYHQGMRDAIDDWLGRERANSIRAGTITRENLPGYLQRQFNVGTAVLRKFFPGLIWLATEANDDEILAACPPQRAPRPRAQGERRGGTSQQSPTTRRAGRGVRTRTHRRQAEARAAEVPPLRDVSPDEVWSTARGSELLKGDVIQVRIDHNWKLEDIRATLRMMQMIERGQSIPPRDDSDDEPSADL